MGLPDHFRCAACGAIAEKVLDRDTRIMVECEPCDAFTAYGPVGAALYRAQHKQHVERHLEALEEETGTPVPDWFRDLYTRYLRGEFDEAASHP